jgi:N-acetylneuraminic acid mutarotase
MTQPRAYHASVLLNDGNILISGGGNGASVSYSTAEIYNSTTRTFKSVQLMKYHRASFTLTLLPSGQVLATGGVDWTTFTYPVTCELYDPITQTWSNTQILNNVRNFHRSVLLNDSVLTMGGENSGINALASCEKYYF